MFFVEKENKNYSTAAEKRKKEESKKFVTSLLKLTNCFLQSEQSAAQTQQTVHNASITVGIDCSSVGVFTQ